MRRECLTSLSKGRGPRYLVAIATEHDAEHASDSVVVFDDEYAGMAVVRHRRNLLRTRRRHEWQLEPEFAPLSDRGVDADAPTLLLDERARDRESEARST